MCLGEVFLKCTTYGKLLVTTEHHRELKLDQLTGHFCVKGGGRTEEKLGPRNKRLKAGIKVNQSVLIVIKGDLSKMYCLWKVIGYH